MVNSNLYSKQLNQELAIDKKIIEMGIPFINFLTVYLPLVISVHKKSKVDADNVGEHDTFDNLQKFETFATPQKIMNVSTALTNNSNPIIPLPPTFDSLLRITYLAMHFQGVC